MYNPKQKTNAPLHFRLIFTRIRVQKHHKGVTQGLLTRYRAYAVHKKCITPNKRQMLHYILDSSLPESEFKNIIKELHRDSLGQPELKTSKTRRDVAENHVPVPECMCGDSHTHFNL